ncbi:FAS1 domain [Trinorchestia longiramus]|nr:FAS1 domain [Trinorchestia longiramus]
MKRPLTLALWVMVICSCVPALTHAKKIPRWWMKVAQRQGPNACVVEEVPGTGKEFWTECRYWLNRKICGRKTIVRFECCEGFEQIEGENGCTRVKPLTNLLETAEALGATRWAAYIRESGLANELETAGAYTLFAPTNEAFDSVRSSLKSQLESYRGNPNNPVLLYHIVPTKLPSDHFEANTVVETRTAGSFLRINKYSNGMNTINCALLLQKDQQATNGIVHIIDSVLDPSKSLSDNVADLVLKDGRFTVLSEMLEKSGYINVLRTMQGSVTFLAPSDEAFQKLPDSRREKIINDREARLALIQNHIIPHVICESAITGEHKVRTVSSNKLTFNCDISGAYVETSKLRGNFNLGKNGIIHILDDVLLPDRAKNLIELAESRQLFTFAELVRNAGLEETLSHTGDYTFFVPDENAWFELDPEVLQQARRDVEYAGLLIRFHGAYGRHLTNAITDNQAIMSLDEENPVRLQVWRRAMGVEDARITTPDVEAQNGVIHIINRVIFPSNKTAVATLRSLPGRDTFDSYLGLLQRTSSQSPPALTLRPEDETFYTFFAPTDAAVDRMDSVSREKLRRGDQSFSTMFVKKHLAINMFPYTSFEPNLIYSIEGMDGSTLNIKKNSDGQLSVNDVPVSTSHMSANGVIHVIEDVFPVSSGGYGSSSSSYSSSSSHSSGSYEGTGGSYYSSSSSSSAGGGASSRTTQTYRRTVTFAEGFEDENPLSTYPQGSELSSSIRGRPETVPSPSENLPTYPESPSSRNRGVSSYDVPSTDSDVNSYEVHGTGTESSSSVSSQSETNKHGNYNLSYYDAHEHEPGLDKWEKVKSTLIQGGNTARQNNDEENNDETNTDDFDYDQVRREEERRRRMEIIRQEEIARQEMIRLEDERRRQADAAKARKVKEEQEELERREEEARLEAERTYARQREEDLRRQREENERIEKENRLRDLQEQARIEAMRKQEEARILEEERRQEVRRRDELQRQEEIRRQEEQRVRVIERQENLRREEELYRRKQDYDRDVGSIGPDGEPGLNQVSPRRPDPYQEQSYVSEAHRRNEAHRRVEEEYRRRQGPDSAYERENARRKTSRTRYEWSTAESRGDQGTNAEIPESVHEPGLLTRNLESAVNSHSGLIPSIPFNNTSASTSTRITSRVASHNTIGPVTPNGTRYSYVGRSYGDDIVGHSDSANINPYSAGEEEGSGSYHSSSHAVNSNTLGGGLLGSGRTTTTTRKRVNVTRTVYSYPVTDINRTFSGTILPHRYPGRRRSNNRDSSNDYGQYENLRDQPNSDSLSAYAFTGGETEFADGREFAEAESPSLATISLDQARAMRRQWRRKRHHILRGKSEVTTQSKAAKRNLKRFRKGRGRGPRKALKKKQGQRRMRKNSKSLKNQVNEN